MQTLEAQSIVHHPHDHAFKSAMVDVRVAREFFEWHLPEPIKPLVNLESLNLEPCSFVDEALQSSATDLLYRTEFNFKPAKQGYLYLLVEQQTQPDRWLPLRLLKYLCRAWERHRIQHPHGKELPLIVPLIFYTGKTPYSYSTDFFDLFGDHQALARQLLLGSYHLVQLHEIPYEKIVQHPWVGLLELLMKHAPYRDTLALLEQALCLLRPLLTEAGADNYVISMLHYLLDQGEVKNLSAFFALIRKQLPQHVETKIMTIAEQLRQQGIQEGVQQGLQQGEATLLIEQLEYRFGALSSPDRERIYQAKTDTLLQWSKRIFAAKTLKDIFNLSS